MDKKIITVLILLLFVTVFVNSKVISNKSRLNYTDSINDFIVSILKTDDKALHKKLTGDLKKSCDLFPIIDNNYTIFIYYNDNPKNKIKKVSVSGDFNKYGKYAYMDRVGNTDVFIKKMRLKSTDNAMYYYTVSYENIEKVELDYFNDNYFLGKKMKNLVRIKDSQEHTIQIIKKLEPKSELIKKRDIYVYLPPEYFKDTQKYYPVLYMHDGQQIWDSNSAAHGGWKMDTTATRLIRDNAIEPLIIVGINNTPDRDDEYMGWSQFHKTHQKDVKSREDDPQLVQDIADAYEDYITNTVKPMIDQKYRTNPGTEFTGMGGASSGAMISLHMGFKYNDVFSQIAAVSGGLDYYYDIADNDFKINSGLKIYLDCGDYGLDKILLPGTQKIYEELINLDFTEGENLYYEIFSKAAHNEGEWAKRVDKFLIFLYGKNN